MWCQLRWWPFVCLPGKEDQSIEWRDRIVFFFIESYRKPVTNDNVGAEGKINLNTFNILRQETVISIVSLCLVLVLLTSLTVVFTWKRWKRRLLLARSAQVSRSGRSSQIRRLFFFSLFSRGGWKLPLLTFAKVKDDQFLTPQQWINVFAFLSSSQLVHVLMYFSENLFV